ncbi:APC family permease [uncultured Sphingomonas sp.]|uniref:APC family permease n=1 Tax=uncultured Sphingomonas sp. TaxID=158754 RepID=UPI0035CA0043
MSRPDPPGPVPLLGPREAIAITVGIVIGAGIFKAPSLVAGASDGPVTMLLAWALGGAISTVGALCYGELASAYPGPGGDYRYLVRAYGGRIGFLYGWARLAIIQTGSVALLAYVFGDYMASVLPGGAAIYAALAVTGLTALNWLGLRAGTTTQNWLVLVEVLGLVVVIVAGLLFAPTLPAQATVPVSSEGALGLVLVFVLLTYGGWSEAVYVSAELRDAPRLMWRVLVIGLGFVTLLYLLVNLAYLRGLGLAGMAASDAVAADLMRRVAGPAGATLIAGIVAIAALTSANATIFTGARSSFALGRDVPALGWLGRWDAGRATPGNALLVQGAAALLLVAAGAVARDGFRLAVEYTAPVFWLFFLLVGISLFVLRAREPDLSRPFRVPLYPVLPLLFCLTNAWLLWSSLAYTGWGALVGVAVLGLGAIMLPWIDSARHPDPAKEPVP